MNKEQEEQFVQFIAEFALENDLKFDDDDNIRAIELFDDCKYRWRSGSNTLIQNMVKDHDIDKIDEDIVEIVSVASKNIHSN